jgi:hypothetical protein
MSVDLVSALYLDLREQSSLFFQSVLLLSFSHRLRAARLQSTLLGVEVCRFLCVCCT